MHIDLLADTHKVDYCTLRSSSECVACDIANSLMCRFELKDLVIFLLAFLPFGVAVVAGMVRAGYGIFLLGWAAYWIFFFFVWEARVLCRHCPYWAEDSRILYCHANYGVFKMWKHDPRPMNASEKLQFIVGAFIFIGYPFLFLCLGREYILALVAMAGLIASGANLKMNTCTRCINFSCPLNSVPKSVVDQYLLKNPTMLKAWESKGYKINN
jgi:hypothetical protein